MTDELFQSIQIQIDLLRQASRRGSYDDRERFAIAQREWQEATSLPQATDSQRAERDRALIACARRHRLTRSDDPAESGLQELELSLHGRRVVA